MAPSQQPALGKARLSRLLLQLERGGGLSGAAQPAAALASPAAARERVRSFRKGLLAHLVLVPSWVLSPALLLVGLVAAGAPLGARGVAAALAAGGGLAASSRGPARSLLCAAVAALAAAAPRRRARALAAAGAVSALAWACGEGDFGRRPGLVAFLMRWAGDYYRQAELRFAPAANVRHGRSFFAFHPHGCLSAGWTINGTFNPEFMRRVGRVTWLVDPNLRHKNPSFKVLCDAYRAEDRAIEAGDPEGFRDLMSRGESLALIPGGFQDAVVFQYQKERTVIRRRKGFIKYCLQYGYRVHPVYTFGESETYYTFTGLERLRNWISTYKIPMVAFIGWPLCPFLPWPQVRIITYVGRGIDMPLLPSATEEDVDHWHSVYLAALRQLFDEAKGEAGYPDAELEIL